MDQKVSGTGFFSTHKYALMPDALGTEGWLNNGVEVNNHVHGSGQIDTNLIMNGESDYTNQTWVNGIELENGTIVQDQRTATITAQLDEDGKMIYSPTAMGVGSGYYGLHPVSFNSLLNEDNWIKNRDGLNSLYHRVDYAHGLDIALHAESDTTNNTMNVEEDLTNGRAHFGALQLEQTPADWPTTEAWKKPSLILDENYVGTYHIKENINLYTSSENDTNEDQWLPCCFGGWDTMRIPFDTKNFGQSTKGVFDCTCFKTHNVAEFTEPAESKAYYF
jgi:hypothetical protein